jgi:hypothetical protein
MLACSLVLAVLCALSAAGIVAAGRSTRSANPWQHAELPGGAIRDRGGASSS